jgi:hypothetical protein
VQTGTGRKGDGVNGGAGKKCPYTGNLDVPGTSRDNNYPPISSSDEEEDEPPSKRQKEPPSRVSILNRNGETIDNLNYRSREVTFSINAVPPGENPVAWVVNAVDDIVQDLLSDIPNNGNVLINVSNKNNPEKCIDISLRRKDQITTDVILGEVEKVIQSNEKFAVDEITIKVHHVRNETGGHVDRKKLCLLEANDYATKKRSCITVNNEGTDCLAHAIVLAVARLRGSKAAKSLRNSKKRISEEATKLCREANVDLSNGGGRVELEQFQQYLQDYKITVYNDRDGRELFFVGDGSGTKGNINLHLENDHYNVITCTKAFFACRYYCEACYKRCDTRNHRCEKSCGRCKHTPICVETEKVACGDCNRLFNGLQCFQNHKINAPNHNKSACDLQKACPACGTFYLVDGKNKRHHVCNERFCQFCLKFVDPQHQCFMATAEIKNLAEYKKEIERTQFIFYDLETKQTTHDENTGYVQEPNLCYINSACHLCMYEEDLTKYCIKCGDRAHTFLGKNCIGDFLNYMFTSENTKNFKKVICVAHNGKSYDTVLICRYIMNNRPCIPQLICVGSKILSMVFAGRIKFIDSVNFMPMNYKTCPRPLA